jgi:hypothetical protein
MVEEPLFARKRQHGDSILSTLGVMHGDFVALEVDVLDAEPKPLEQCRDYSREGS